MTDWCTVGRPTGKYVTDPETGKDVPELEPVWEGPCKLQSTPHPGEQRISGEHRFTSETPGLHLPARAPVQTDDEATLIESAENPANSGLHLVLTGLDRGTYRTAQRWNVEVLT